MFMFINVSVAGHGTLLTIWKIRTKSTFGRTGWQTSQYLRKQNQKCQICNFVMINFADNKLYNTYEMPLVRAVRRMERTIFLNWGKMDIGRTKLCMSASKSLLNWLFCLRFIHLTDYHACYSDVIRGTDNINLY